MDPIAAIGEQSRRMVENTQRSSASLHSQTVKRHKDRIRRGQVNSSSYRSREADDAYDGDFFGDDDGETDYSGSSGNAELFRQMWDEDVEANQPEPMAGDTIFEEGTSSGLLGNDDAAGYDYGAYTEGQYENGEYAEGDQPSEAGIAGTGDSLQLRPTYTAGDEPSDGAEMGERPAGELGASATYTDKEVEEKAAVNAADGLRPETKAEPEGAEDEVEQDEETADPDAPSPDQIAMGDALAEIFGNLNTLIEDDNFVHVDSKADILQFENGVAPSESMPRKELPPVSADMGEILDRLMVGQRSSAQWERLRSFLSRFGKGVLSTCVAREIKVHLLGSGQLKGVDVMRAIKGSEDIDGALYVSSNKTLYIDESTLEGVPYGSNPVIFYMAQAWDHALGEEEFASLHSPMVLANYEACRSSLDGHRFADELSARSPVYYFAQSVESYLAENDCQDVLWSREDLYDFDRSMYDYVEYLFKQANR